MGFQAKQGLDIAFAAIFVLAIGLTVTDDIVTNLTTSNGTPPITGTSATVIGYATLVMGAAFLYIVARMSGIL